jgi:transposase
MRPTTKMMIGELEKQVATAAKATCWWRLRDLQRAGVWDRLHRVLLDKGGLSGEIY